jgi:hypothetical protein
MWGFAFSLDPRAWRLGKRDAYDVLGRVVGVWWCFGRWRSATTTSDPGKE